MTSMTGTEHFAEAWRDHRSYLVNVAFRMLGNIGDAEDVVQEAFSRLLRTKHDEIEDERGWLTVATSRLCLDQIKSARARHEQAADFTTQDPDRELNRPLAVDPADRITLDDSVRLALLVVLERLSPAERVVFVLHDMFQVPFDTIAITVGRAAPGCRQLARRARKKIEDADGRRRSDITASEHRLVTERFIAACANGDLEELLQVLDPEVSGVVDIREGLVVTGAPQVARNLLFYFKGATVVAQPVGGQPAVMAFVERELAVVLALTIDADRIRKIHAIADPLKLSFLRAQLSARS
jgi:RNA polymerase sigma-70 factor, ECF subfamily